MVARLAEEEVGIWSKPAQYICEQSLDLEVFEVHKQPVGEHQIVAGFTCTITHLDHTDHTQQARKHCHTRCAVLIAGVARVALTYSAMHEQRGTIQLFAAAKCRPRTFAGGSVGDALIGVVSFSVLGCRGV